VLAVLAVRQVALPEQLVAVSEAPVPRESRARQVTVVPAVLAVRRP